MLGKTSEKVKQALATFILLLHSQGGSCDCALEALPSKQVPPDLRHRLAELWSRGPQTPRQQELLEEFERQGRGLTSGEQRQLLGLIMTYLDECTCCISSRSSGERLTGLESFDPDLLMESARLNLITLERLEGRGSWNIGYPHG